VQLSAPYKSKSVLVLEVRQSSWVLGIFGSIFLDILRHSLTQIPKASILK
jgi:hypothetical protein